MWTWLRSADDGKHNVNNKITNGLQSTAIADAIAAIFAPAGYRQILLEQEYRLTLGLV